MPRFFLAAALFAGLAGPGCKNNPASCELDANKNSPECLTPDGGPVSTACKADPDCAGKAGGPVCDTTQNKCVQCTANENKCDANGTTPRCDATETCVACVDDNDCSAGAGTCLPTGGCAAPETIIHAASVPTNIDLLPNCGDGTHKPCSLEDALTIAKADSTKKVIRLEDNGTFVPTVANFVVNANIAIEAHTAILHHKVDGPILRVTNGKSLTFLGGTVEGAINNGGTGIECDSSSTLFVQKTVIQNNKESAISSTGCTVTIDSAKLQGNSTMDSNFPAIFIAGGSITIYHTSLSQNRGGEIDIRNGATFAIVGNVFQNNGDPNGSNAGISISSSTSSANRLEFNTISANKSQFISGVQCVAGTFTAQNNIIWNNTGSPQLGGTCVHDYSVVGLTVTYPAGTNGGHNASADPKLVSETTDPHIQGGSSAIKAANPGAELTGIAAKDIDGDTRTSPADCGADQTH